MSLDKSNIVEQKFEVESLNKLKDIYLNVSPVWVGQIDYAKTSANESVVELILKFQDLSKKVQSLCSQDAFNKINENLLLMAQKSNDYINKVETTLYKNQNAISTTSDLVDGLSIQFNNLTLILNQFQSQFENSAAAITPNPYLKNSEVQHGSQDSSIQKFAVESKSILNNFDKVIKSIEIDISKLKEKSSCAKSEESNMTISLKNTANDLTDDFNSLTKEVSHSKMYLSEDINEIKNQISDILFFLQFQDRVNQVLTHVNEDIKKYTLAIKTENYFHDSESWLKELKETYTMKEEEDIHTSFCKFY